MSISRASRPFALAILLPAIIAAGPASAEPGGDVAGRVFVGYLHGRPRNVNYKLYTHLCHAFLVADGEGRIKPDRNIPDPGLTAEAHKAGVAVLLSLGGWGWDDQFRAITSDPSAEERYATSVIQVVDAGDYDGIDFDWEYPDTRAEVAGFERLTRRFRRDLDELGKRKGRPIRLTMAASSNPGTLRWLDRAFLMETMDWINVMTYDYAGDWTDHAGHNAPLFASPNPPGGPRSVAGTIDYLLAEKGLPADRLTLGIPLYGRGFNVPEPYAPTRGVPKGGLPRGDYANLRKLHSEQGWTRTWDDVTKTPWLRSPDGKAVIGYDDAESVAIKADWARRKVLRGVFFWQVNADRLPDGTNPLQEAAHEASAAPGR